jgi:hypothetical protein
MKRLLFVVAALSATVLLVANNAQAATESSVPRKETVTTSGKVASIGGISLRPAVSTLDDPPSGGCSGDISFTTTANYLNGVLTDTETPYTGSVTCDVVNPGETMRFLQADAALFINGGLREPDAGPGSCGHETAADPPCVGTSSSATAVCLELSERCDGSYIGKNQFDMLLPDGWEWGSWPPECSLIHPTELTCLVQTDPLIVPPTI